MAIVLTVLRVQVVTVLVMLVIIQTRVIRINEVLMIVLNVIRTIMRGIRVQSKYSLTGNKASFMPAMRALYKRVRGVTGVLYIVCMTTHE